MIIFIKKAVCYITENSQSLIFIIIYHIIKQIVRLVIFFKAVNETMGNLNSLIPDSRIDAAFINGILIFSIFPYTTAGSLVPNSPCTYIFK